MAVETGVDGVDVVIGTSSYLREHSHGKDMTYIRNTAIGKMARHFAYNPSPTYSLQRSLNSSRAKELR